MRKVAAIVAALSLFSLVPALGGVVFHIETKDIGGSSSDVRQNTISVEGNRMMMEVDAGTRVVYDGNAKKMVIINDKEKNYMELDKETIDDLAAKIAPAMKQLEQMREQMANMPPAQRAMMEKMMGDRMGQMAERPAPIEVTASSQRQNVVSYPCVRYDVHRGEDKIREMWVTDWENIDGAKQAEAVFLDMATFFQDAFQSFSLPGFAMPENAFTQMKKVDGFPVRSVDFSDGRPATETIFRSVEEKPLGDSFFTAPKGYKKRKMGR